MLLYYTDSCVCALFIVDTGERSRAYTHARLERRAGGTTCSRSVLRSLSETVQDRDAQAGTQLHRSAGRHTRAWRSTRQPHLCQSSGSRPLSEYFQHGRQFTSGQPASTAARPPRYRHPTISHLTTVRQLGHAPHWSLLPLWRHFRLPRPAHFRFASAFFLSRATAVRMWRHGGQWRYGRCARKQCCGQSARLRHTCRYL